MVDVFRWKALVGRLGGEPALDSAFPWIVAVSVCRRVSRLILATAHAAGRAPRSLDARLVADIDLAVLGAPPAEFDAYERGIRAEYAWVPPEAYREGRGRVLRAFLRRRRIYRTESFEDRLGSCARENLQRAMEKLFADALPEG